MSLTIKNLIIRITIGGKEIILDSTTLGEVPDKIENNIKKGLKSGFSFRMRKETKVSVTVGEIVSWFETNFSGHVDTLGNDVKGFINKANSNDTTDLNAQPTALDGILLELSDLYFTAIKAQDADPSTTSFRFGFTLKVSLDQNFYNGLGLQGITNIISLNSVGFSLAYTNN